MSYARWSEGDIYVYGMSDGSYVCMQCPLMPTFQGTFAFQVLSDDPELRDAKSTIHESFSCHTLKELQTHILQHIEEGHSVPARCLADIEREIEEETDGD